MLWTRKMQIWQLFQKKVHHKPKSFCSISTINRRKKSKYWFLSNSSSRQLYCSFDNPTKRFSPNSRNTSAQSRSEDDKVKQLPQKMFYLEMLLRRERMRSFCNTTCNVPPKVWKKNSKNPQLERNRFPKTWFPSDFSFKTARMQFWHTCQKVSNEGLNFFA